MGPGGDLRDLQNAHRINCMESTPLSRWCSIHFWSFYPQLGTFVTLFTSSWFHSRDLQFASRFKCTGGCTNCSNCPFQSCFMFFQCSELSGQGRKSDVVWNNLSINTINTINIINMTTKRNMSYENITTTNN